MRELTMNVVVMLLALVGCMGCGNQPAFSVDGFIRVDVMASYSEKELILQGLMDVEYIALETTDDFITKGTVKATGRGTMLVTNRGSGGDTLVFGKGGEGLKEVNRLGQNGEEYTQLTGLVLDKDNDEIFVKDNPARKIDVYDLLGDYKRSFKFTGINYYSYTFNYDRDHSICYKSYPLGEGKREYYLTVSRQDGRIIHEIQIPSKGIETPVVTEGEFVIAPEFYFTFPDQDKWILISTSSDTMFHYSPDGNLSPFIVKSPSISSVNMKVSPFPVVTTDHYCFMETVRKEIGFMTFRGLLGEDLVYDKQENALFSYILYNDNLINKEGVSLTSEPRNSEITVCQTLDAPDLTEAYEKGQLKGRLREIAANLDEELNPVTMLLEKRE